MLRQDEGPTSSMEEDIKALKLDHIFLTESSEPRATDDDSVAPRNEVDVRAEGAGEDDYGATKATPPPADTDDKPMGAPTPPPAQPSPAAGKPDADGDEDGDKHAEPDGDEPPSDDEVKEAVEAIVNMTESDVDSLDEEELDGALMVIGALEDLATDPAPKLEAAFGVIDSFYNQLAEGETNTIDRDSLVGIVEAMEFVLADFGLLGESKGFGKLIARRSARGMAKGHIKPIAAMDKPHKVKEMKVKLGKTGSFKQGLKHAKLPTLGKSGKKHEQAGAETTLSSLVSCLVALRDVVAENKQVATTGAELAEGLKAIKETATAWYESIAREIKPQLAEGKLDQNDPRILIGRHLNGIAEDAAKNLTAIESGQPINVEAAEHNLSQLAADLDDAAEVMKQVD